MEGGHLILFPFMAQGHVIPFLNLGKVIEQRKRFTITIVNTPLNILKLQSSLPSNSAIHLVELPFSSSDHGLPPDSENTDFLPIQFFTTFFKATETLRPSFEHLVSNIIRQQGHSRLCIIADVFLGWTVESAKKLGMFHSVFVTFGDYASAIVFSLWLRPPLLPESCDEVPLEDLPEVKLQHTHITNTIILSDPPHPLTLFLRQQTRLSLQSSGLLLNTVEELEREGLRLLRKSSGLPVWSVGPLVRLPSSSRASDTWKKFLDSNPPASVLYVSFGSQNTIPASQMMELAMGLEASGKPSIWVIRTPSEIEAGENIGTEWLPEGFEDGVAEKQQGFLVRGWAPQPEILSHTSIGAFLSHCGWNSVLESLSQGVPIIGWPLLSDQLFNSKMMEEEIGVCVGNCKREGTQCIEEWMEGCVLPKEKGWSGILRNPILAGAMAAHEGRTIKIEKFNGEDFNFWKMQIEDHLYQKGMHLPLLGIKPTEIKAEDWALLGRQALGAIRLTLFRNVAFNIAKEKTTASLIAALSDMYKKPSASNKVHLMRRLFNLRMKEGASVATHINEFSTVDILIDFDDNKYIKKGFDKL